MWDFRQQARRALQVYLERGALALKYFSDERLDRFEVALRRMTAAFHNFKAADAILRANGEDIADDVIVKQLLPEIQRMDSDVQTAVIKLQGKITSELVHFSKVKTNIGKYRSGMKFRSAFAQAV